MAYNQPGGSFRLATRPRNVEQITKAAQSYEYSALVPLRYWLRTAGTMLKEAEIYEREGDDEQAYLLLFRHAHLVLTNLAVHPDAPISELLKEAKKDVQHNLKKLDKLNPRIKRRYERYQDILSEREARRLALLEAQHSEVEGDAITFQGALESDNVHHLEAGENKELAVQLAQNEMSRRATERKATRQAGMSEDEGTARRAARVWQVGDQEPDDLSRRLQEVRAQVERPGRAAGPSTTRRAIDPAYSYPTVPSNHAIQSLDPPLSSRPTDSSHNFYPPALPPKSALRPNISAPPLPEKASTTIDISPLHDPTPTIPRKISTATTDISSPYDPTPAIPPKLNHHPPSSPSTQKPTYTFLPTARTESGHPLRTLFLPPTLRRTFLHLSSANTVSNLETCAFLAGTLLSNALFVSKLIFPRQTATSDTCEMTHESDLFDYIDGFEDLMILGWIHTHPRQGCFMSSRDLHTQVGYQVMLPESVAVVCAPSKTGSGQGRSEDGGGGGGDELGEYGVFRLTDPPGKAAILACAKPGVFHPHEVPNLYTDALRPGHVVEAKGLEFEVVDLR